MFGSQALETAIGLALLFFVIASLASAVVEAVSRLLRKRAKDLQETIGQMLSGSNRYDAAAKDALELFKGTAIFQSADIAASRGRRWFRTDVGPAYLSARSFAEGVDELLEQVDDTPFPGLDKRLAHLRDSGREHTLEAKAAMENWYDETMGRLSGAYKRWATAVLFVVGLFIAVAGNVSAPHAAQTLWQQPAVREAAVNAAAKDPSGDVAASVRSVQDLAGLGMPVGWQQGADWGSLAWTSSHVAGWLVTALLLMLGAPFWFDALSRLVSLRATGAKPPTADHDPAAATSLRASAMASVAPAAVSAAAVAAAEAAADRREVSGPPTAGA